MSICGSVDRCKSCAHWNGHRASEYGDCNWIIGEIVPEILQSVSIYEDPLRLPFDPHECKYFCTSRIFKKAYKEARKCSLPSGIMRVFSDEKDTQFNKDGELKVCTTSHAYFRTHKDFLCNFYRRKYGSYSAINGSTHHTCEPL